MNNCSVAIMQPTFFPWAGYFKLIQSVDKFIFLDNVQLESSSWQTRNSVIINSKPSYINIPVRRRMLSQTISETEILVDSHYCKKLYKLFDNNYRRKKYYQEIKNILDIFFENHKGKTLSEINIILIKYIMNNLSIKDNTLICSDINITEIDRINRLVSICDYFQASHYYTPVGALDYLTAGKFTEYSSANLVVHDLKVGEYHQEGLDKFVSHLSILDVVANLGWSGAKEYLQNGLTRI